MAALSAAGGIALRGMRSACRRAPIVGSLRRSAALLCTATSAPLSYPPPIVSRPRSAPHTATVIFLHGLGDSGAGWSAIAEEFRPFLQHCKFIFPNAPMRPISLNMGMRMPGWYDIASLDDINQQEDAEGLLETKRYVEELVKAEVEAGVPSDRIVVAGFSQGGASSLMMLRSDMKLAGIAGLSCYLPLRDRKPVVSEVNKSTPILMCHGDQDQTVLYSFGREAFDMLHSMGMDVEFNTYRGMAHSACQVELQDVLDFIKDKLKPLDA